MEPLKPKHVWRCNVAEELPRIVAALQTARFVAVDTEYPGLLFRTPPRANPSDRYRDLRRNVAAIKLLQLGFSVFCRDGLRHQWQVNFGDFDLSSPLHARWEPSVAMLQRNGVDFDRARRDGVSSAYFFAELRRRIDWTDRRERPVWVTFHGLYDVGYLLSMLRSASLPENLPEFARLAGRFMGTILDLKFVAQSCGEAPASLVKMAENLAVTAPGKATPHQAGANSVLTGRIFTRMSVRLRLLDRVDHFSGLLHGIEAVRIFDHLAPPPAFFPIYPAVPQPPLASYPIYPAGPQPPPASFPIYPAEPQPPPIATVNAPRTYQFPVRPWGYLPRHIHLPSPIATARRFGREGGGKNGEQ